MVPGGGGASAVEIHDGLLHHVRRVELYPALDVTLHETLEVHGHVEAEGAVLVLDVGEAERLFPPRELAREHGGRHALDVLRGCLAVGASDAVIGMSPEDGESGRAAVDGLRRWLDEERR